jgi:hypothetical protein
MPIEPGTLNWIYYGMGAIAGTMFGTIISGIMTFGKAFYIRFVLKKTPIEPYIIGTGKVSVPVLAIDDDRFEYNGFPYIVPKEDVVPKSLITGSVSAPFFEGIPTPMKFTPRSIGFKLKDNTILSKTMRIILQADSLSKMFSREKVTNFHILLAVVFGILVTGISIQMMVGLQQMFPQLITEFNSSMETMRAAVAQYLTPDAVNTVNPKGPTAVPPPPGG